MPEPKYKINPFVNRRLDRVLDRDGLDDRYLQVLNDLSDLNDAATARTNLGLVAGGAGDIWVEKAGDSMTGDLTFDGAFHPIIDPGSDTDAVLLEVNVTGTPQLSWDESEDAFALTNSLISDTDSTDDLGSTTKFWANAYVDKLHLYFDGSNPAFLERESFGGSLFISGKTDGNNLKFLAQGGNMILGTKSGASLYSLNITPNTTYGVNLDASKAGGEGVIVLGSGTDLLPFTDSSLDLGSSTLFWANVYTDLLHLSSTISIDGSESGVVKFTGADLRPDSDSTRDLGAAGVTAKDQLVETAGASSHGFFGANWLGQSFTSGSGVTNVSSVKLTLKKESGTPGTVFVDIFLEGGDDKPTGASLGQASIPAMSNSAYELKTFTFSSAITISASTKYVIVLSSPDSTSWQRAHVDNTNPYADGVWINSTDSGSGWSLNAGDDGLFQTFTESDFFWAELYVDDIFCSGTALVGETTKQTNVNNLQIAGDWAFKEASAPTADDGYGKLWTDTDNMLWFQSGDGNNHLLHGDAFSNIWYHGSTTGTMTVEVTIAAQNALALINSFTVVGHEDDLANVVGSSSTNNLTLSSIGGGEYEISFHGSVTATGGADKNMMIALGITLATPKDITDVTDNLVSPIVITSTAHGLENGDMVQIVGVLGNDAANGSFIVSSKADDTFEIIDLSGGATTGDGDFNQGSPTGDVTILYPGNMIIQRAVRGADLGAISATGVHILANSDAIAVYVANLSGTTNLTVAAISFDAFRIGD